VLRRVDMDRRVGVSAELDLHDDLLLSSSRWNGIWSLHEPGFS